MGRYAGMRRRPCGQFLQAATACFPVLPDERGRLCAAAYEGAAGPAVQPAGARYRSRPGVFAGQLRPACTLRGEGPQGTQHRAGRGDGR